MRLLGVFFSLFLAAASSADSLVFIVNKDNPVGSLSPENVREIFLKQTKTWADDSQPIRPLDRALGSSERELFLRSVMKKSPAEMERHWILQKQVTGDVAPQNVGSDR